MNTSIPVSPLRSPVCPSRSSDESVNGGGALKRLQRESDVNTHATRWLTVCACSLCVCMQPVCVCVRVQTRAAADTQTGSCQQHTNKLYGGNQSGGWGGKQQPVINQRLTAVEGWNQFLLSCWVVYLSPGRTSVPAERHADILQRFSPTSFGFVEVQKFPWCVVFELVCGFACRASVLPVRAHGEGHGHTQPDHLVM